MPQWPAKSLVVLGSALLLVQAVSEIIKRLAVMQGLLPDPNTLALSAQEQAAAEAARLAEAIASETH